jgi:putative membrane-bound dehydrogenase-like protein
MNGGLSILPWRSRGTAAASWILLLASPFAGCSRISRQGPPYRPDQALETFQLHEGFKIELLAAEPMVADPVALDVDCNGRMFVVEMPGYPLDTRPTGRVKLLEDTDGDGRPDKSTVFADGIVLPTGVMCWKKGILVTAAPDVLYFEDTDGDRRADVRRVVLTGFPFTNPQHKVNTPVYGLDNWIYLANEPAIPAVVFKEFADPGGDIEFPDQPGVRLKTRGRNIRFRPDEHRLEALSGASQFGHTFDEWGRHFTVNNSNHARHEVIAAAPLERNPNLLARSAMQDASDHGNAAKVFSITRHPEHQLLTNAGEFTSACSLTMYLGGSFPGYEHVSFVAEPAHNLIHADRWAPSRSTFRASRLLESKEFLASTDSWFRPVAFYVAPDGSLLVIDYYRRVIEHPEWMSEQVYRSQAIHDGQGMGRIYRIAPTALRSTRAPIRLDQAPPEELVRNLANSNAWWRRTAQRLLVDRKDEAAGSLLVRLFSESSSAVARVHALWTLEGLGRLPDAVLERALEDPEPGVRENAVRLAEARLSGNPVLLHKVLAMGRDAAPRVRFQVLCALGELDSPEARAARHDLLFEDIEDPWMQVAALSARAGDFVKLFDSAVTRLAGRSVESAPDLFRRLGSIIGSGRNPDELRHVVQAVARAAPAAPAAWNAATLEGIAAGLGRDRNAAKEARLPRELLLDLASGAGSESPLRRAALDCLDVAGAPPSSPKTTALLERMAGTAADPLADPSRRVDALRLLSVAAPGARADMIRGLIDPRQPEEVQAAAVEALGRVREASTAPFLLERLKVMTPRVRSAAVTVLLRQPEGAGRMLAALESGGVQPWMLEWRHKLALVMNRDPAVRTRAQTLLEKNSESRSAMLDRYRAALDLKGSAAEGARVFEKTCTRCHSPRGSGGRFGPDLATVRDHSAYELLADIVMPSRALAQGYETYLVELADGTSLTGIIASQTPNAVTLHEEDGKEHVVSRADIRQMTASRVSAMPEQLEKEITVQRMADLIAFLKATP